MYGLVISDCDRTVVYGLVMYGLVISDCDRTAVYISDCVRTAVNGVVISDCDRAALYGLVISDCDRTAVGLVISVSEQWCTVVILIVSEQR